MASTKPARRGRPASSRHRPRSGLTLVELLVVVVVLAVLAAVLLPQSSGTDRPAVALRLKHDATTVAAGVEAQFDRLGAYPAGAGAAAPTHAELPGVTGSPSTTWALAPVDADGRGAVVVVSDAAGTGITCQVGVGRRRASAPLTCTGE